MATLALRDHNTIWHPCSQMKDYETFAPLEIASAKGSYIKLANGQTLIDATASWWCKSLGHGHPRLRRKLIEQATQFEHVIFANTTHETIVALSEKLTRLTPHLSKVFYAGDGSSAVEIALKMSLQVRQITGETNRTQFLALENGYHGETFGALSVSDVGLYRDPYKTHLFNVPFIQSIPYVNSTTDPLWQNCQQHWQAIEKTLTPHAASATAVIVEPIVQGAFGMRLYSQDFLRRLAQWCQQHDIHLIADEIMTGIGRTGKMLACQHAQVEPDFVCLSKGLTSGWLPFSAVLTTNAIYERFYDDYASGKSFLHSHTYSGNALGAALALETLNIVDDENICDKASALELLMRQHMQHIADETGLLHPIRGIGGIVAADIITQHPRTGYRVFQEAVKRGALLRPLGNTIYWLPPLTTQATTLAELKAITQAALTACF